MIRWLKRKRKIQVQMYRSPCPGAVNIQGGHYPCEENVWPHGGLACHNAEAEAIWQNGDGVG